MAQITPTKNEDQFILEVDDFQRSKYNGLLSRVGLSGELDSSLSYLV